MGHVLGIASGAALLLATVAYARALVDGPRAWLSGVAAWIVLSSCCFSKWSVSGLETPLFAALGVAALGVAGAGYALRSRSTLGVAALACLPAAIVWNLYGERGAPLLVAAVGIAALWAIGRKLRWRRALPAASIAVSVAALGRFAFDGDPTASVTGNSIATAFRFERLVGAGDENHLPDAFVRRQARIILERPSPARLVAHGAIGRFGYYSGLPILDIFGLVDPAVSRNRIRVDGGTPKPGHQRSNADYVLGREPDYILIPKEIDSNRPTASPAVVAIWNHPDFLAEYEWDAQVNGYRRRDQPTSRSKPTSGIALDGDE